MTDKEGQGQFRVTMPGSKNELGGEATPWSKFVKFTQRVVNVPKDEIDEQARKREADNKAKS